MARASKYSKEPEIRKAFEDIAATPGKEAAATASLSLAQLRSYLCDYLGFGRADAERFFEQHRDAGDRVSFDAFRRGYRLLNPYKLEDRKEELIIRKPGALNGEQVNLMRVEDSEVYICDRTAQAFVDYCQRCLVLLGPCESSVFVRDCVDCIFWVAAQQLRTRDCRRCTFFLYSKTEPIIESSDELAFAPWAARYPRCVVQFEQTGFDAQRNLWNAIYDFSGEAHRSHWHILGLGDVRELHVELDDGPDEAAEADSPVPAVTHEQLCRAPLASGGSCGQGVANIPQVRPPPPEPPGSTPGIVAPPLLARDVGLASASPLGMQRWRQHVVAGEGSRTAPTESVMPPPPAPPPVCTVQLAGPSALLAAMDAPITAAPQDGEDSDEIEVLDV